MPNENTKHCGSRDPSKRNLFSKYSVMERIELDNLTYYQVDLGSICLLGFSPEELVIRLATMKNNLITLN